MVRVYTQGTDTQIPSWASEEVASVDLQDKRLNKRLLNVLADLAQRPTASIPAACGGGAETKAAYRLFGNKKVTYEKGHGASLRGDA
jgi:hypothetical protein